MWLIREDVAQAIVQAKRAGITFTAEQTAELFDRRRRSHGGASDNPALTVAGDLAEIRVIGTLTPQPDIFAFFFGGGNTTYSDLIEALAIADTNPEVKRLSMVIHSPGGTVHGLFDTLAAIEAFSKPIRVTASQACSAAYAIAAVAGPIEATNAAAEFGSIGVATTLFVDEDLVDITSTLAPHKRPDPTTDEGKATIRAYLDAVHELFADAIAHGRNTTRNEVDREFGQGAILLAGDAKRRGLIDKIQKPALRPVGGGRSARAGAESEDQMDLATLKAKHPELYAAVVHEGRMLGPIAPEPRPAPQPVLLEEKPKSMDLKTLEKQHPELYDAVIAVGQKEERDRVVAHLLMGEKCGDMKIAIDAIKSGDGMTQTITAQYLMAGMNRADRRSRQAETDGAGEAADGAQTAPVAADMGEQVADMVEELLGHKKKAS